MITSRTGIAKLALLGYPRRKGKGLFGGEGQGICHAHFVPYLIYLVGFLCTCGVYGFVRVSAVNELEGEVEVAYYAAAVILLSIVVPFCL